MIKEYLELSGKKLQHKVDIVCKCIKDNKIRFDSVAYRGHSGALVAPAVAMRLQKPLILVRKGLFGNHSTTPVEGSTARKYIIIDDFISSGETIHEVINSIDNRRYQQKCIAVLTYNCGYILSEVRNIVMNKLKGYYAIHTPVYSTYYSNRNTLIEIK